MDAEDEEVVGRLRAKGAAILVAPAATMQCQNAASVMPYIASKCVPKPNSGTIMST